MQTRHRLAPHLGPLETSLFAQAYLIDRMESIASEQQDKSLKIPGKRFESPRSPWGSSAWTGRARP